MNITRTTSYYRPLLIVGFSLALLFCATSAKAASYTLATPSSLPNYMELKAKLEYLESWLKAIKADGPSAVPPPTFAMSLSGNVVGVTGTIARAPQKDMMEICGTMQKGTIDWGDGFSEPLWGLGCSGDVFTFSRVHLYEERGSQRITVSAGASATKVVAVGNASVDHSRLLNVAVADDTVTARGTVLLRKSLTGKCGEATMATIDWGDGTSESLPRACSGLGFKTTHSYGRPGDYAVTVIDIDGDVAQEIVTIE